MGKEPPPMLIKMTRVKTVLISCFYIISAATLASNTPLPSNDQRLVEELEELSNRIHSPSKQSVENAIYPEIANQPSQPKEGEDLQVLDEHINIPTTLPSDDGSKYVNSLELQLFEAGRDEEGNRIYASIEEQLESLEDNKVGESASEIADDDDDKDDDFENLSENIEYVPSEDPSGESHAGESSDSSEESSEGSSEETSNEGSGNGLDTGSGADSSFLEASGGSPVLGKVTNEEGSGSLLTEEGFVIANETTHRSGESTEKMSGDDGDYIMQTEEPDFVYTTFSTLTADEVTGEQAVTSLNTTTMTTKTSADEKLTPTKTVLRYCRENQFECGGSHHCIPQGTVCDIIPDCDDQSDEDPQMCSTTRICSAGYFKCGNSPQCVEEDSRCDGIYHCYNGEDEANCITCDDRNGHIKKLMPSDFCDGFQDCKNNMDEDERRCRKPCLAGYTRCDDGLQCILEEMTCDGINNCRDKSDEKQCSRSMLDCWTYNMFACDGICQSHTALCDYIDDCSDAMDENGCRYGTPKTCPKEFTYQPETDSCLHNSLIYSEPYDLLQILDQVRETNQQELEQLEERELIM